MRVIRQLFCRHEYKLADSIHGMFGMDQCGKCGKMRASEFTEAKVKTMRSFANYTKGRYNHD